MQVTEHDTDGTTEVLEIEKNGHLFYVRVSESGQAIAYGWSRHGKMHSIYDPDMIAFAKGYLATINE